MLNSFLKSKSRYFFLVILFLMFPLLSMAANSVPSVAGIRIEFILFAITLIGVALFHKKTMYVALAGLTVILIFKFIFDSEFNFIEHLIGSEHREGEWRILLNLMGLLFGFGILAKHFEESKLPSVLPKFLPDNWKGGLVLLFFIFILSSFLDNIAAAMIGGTIAMVVYKGKLHLGFLAAIVAASNAGGAPSVIGDTTTTLMWIDGVNPVDVLHAGVASLTAFAIFGVVGAIQQDRYNRITKDAVENIKVDWGKIGIVALILVGAIITNYTLDFPAIGVWIAILIGWTFRKTPWHEIKNSLTGTIFLIALVSCASLMPVEELPPASIWSAFALGFVSAVFDNIPLTKLCLDQGGYDWGVLAYAVGFGGSMIWFGSSAGVALSNMYPETRKTVNYITKGWHVAVAYVIGFFVLISTLGWQPHEPHRKTKQSQTEVTEPKK